MKFSDMTRLLNKQDWEKAVLHVNGIGAIGISEPEELNATLIGDDDSATLSLKMAETPDPFYNPARDGVQPKVCMMEKQIPISEIKGIDYVNYARIIQSEVPKIILP